MILGAGSISDETMANMYISSGSNFIVGPLTNENVAVACNRKKIPYMPGCLTPSEISKAEELGCDVVKVFPADSVDGASFIKSVLAPMPWSWIMPTGGVDMEEEGLKIGSILVFFQLEWGQSYLQVKLFRTRTGVF